MYLRVTGFLSLIIILIIVVYYYLQSNHSKILEKYENYALRDCKVYFTEGDTNIKNCDITQETSNYTGSCSYRFDGWNEFDTYTDNDGKTITYPKKVYTQTRTNTNDFDNPMFTNNCFKNYTTDTCIPGQPTDNCTPPEFEYNTNGIVKYDEIGKSGNSAVGNNIYGGTGYSSMQFLNTTDPRTNNINLISSICDVPLNNTLGSLKDKVFYMFEFNATTNKLENIRSVTLNSDQTTFSPVSSDNVLMNLPLRPIDASFYGLQYDATNNNLPIKIFKKNNILRNVAIFKFNYMSYICTQSQIKNYMTARRNIYPEKFIKYGSSTIPYYSKNISISNNMTIKDGWGWSNYSSADLNLDYSDMLNTDLNTSKDEREDEIYNSPANVTARANARTAYLKAKQEYDDASYAQDNFSTNYKSFSSLIGLQKPNSITKLFNYKLGYRTTSIDNFNISIPQGATATKIGSDVCIIFNNAAQASQLTIPTGGAICDIFMIGGGGGGGNNCAGGGGAGACIVALGQTINAGNYTIAVGAGGSGGITANANGTIGGDTSIGSLYVAKGGGFGAGGGGTIGGTGGCGGGAVGGGNNTNSARSSLNVVNGITNISPSTTSTYSVLGNIGGSTQQYTDPNYHQLNGAGGGGIGVAGTNSSISACGPGGNGIYQVVINSFTYNLRSYFANNRAFGVQDGSTGNYYIGGGGAGGGFNSSGTITISGGLGGGGNGFDSPTTLSGTAGNTNTGSGGGGGNGNYGKGGAGGSGLVIIRIKIKESINNFLGALTDNTTSSDTDITTTTTLDKSKIKANVLSSFIFLQRGRYKISAGLASPDNILYSELIIYDNTTNNIIYSYGDNKQSYIIDINDAKFYKLAFRYIYCNFTNDNINLSSFKIQCDNQGLDLTNYLFGGVNINIDYRNSTIMNLLTNVRYEDNSDTSYNKIRVHLDTINFFNINALKDESKRTKDYMDTGLDAIIRATYATDASIININRFIDKINSLKSSNNRINYVSELPTTSPSIYKDITIDEIFGRSFDRLITKERVDPLIQPPVPSTKKIYVEAVAA